MSEKEPQNVNRRPWKEAREYARAHMQAQNRTPSKGKAQVKFKSRVGKKSGQK